MLSTAEMLPADSADATLVGRLMLDDGPTPVIVRRGIIEDISQTAPTVSDLMDLPEPADVIGQPLFPIDELQSERLLAPVDLQAVKAAGVTFAISAIERVIEERARGDFRRG